ncbi:MAG: hypothetical protein QM756_26535 [Polyangiaceae bacterium]
MRWYVMANGQTVGPEEGETIMQWGRDGLLLVGSHVRDELGGNWMPVEQSPFASVVRDIAAETRGKLAFRNGLIRLVVGLGAVSILFLWMCNDIEKAKHRPTEQPLVEAAINSTPVVQPSHVDVRREMDRLKVPILPKWGAYDVLPKAQKTKKKLFATFDATVALARMAPDSYVEALIMVSQSLARERLAPLVLPETRATGELNQTLVPSEERSKCVLWAATWINDDETLRSLRTLGFQKIACAETAWSLKAEATTCFLYWTKSADHDANDPVFVWKDLPRYRRAQVAGRATGEDAVLRMLALVSEGASTMMPGGSYVIVKEDDDWAQIQGVSAQDGIAGIVDRAACHHKPRR